jgi:hypothetical protein
MGDSPLSPIPAYHHAGFGTRPDPLFAGPLETMNTMTTFALSDVQRSRAEALVEPALRFLAASDHLLGESLVRSCWSDGASDAVATSLAAYQNEDGGFGKGLEVDIKAPISNPFAGRLAMQVMLTAPPSATEALRAPFARWLAAHQHEDGDWHFAPEVLQHEIAPWFAEWTFPSLNPACCIAGYAQRLGLATPEMLARVASLFERLGSTDEARTGQFYNVLPYVEYVAGIEFPERDDYVAAIAAGVSMRSYDDAQHFFDHAINGGLDLVAQIPSELLSSQADRLMDEVANDGGWPTPYDPAWRPWATATAMTTLARLRDGV